MLPLVKKASSTRRAEAISAVESSRTGMAKTRGGVAIGRCGIINGDHRLEIVSNRRDRVSISGNDILD
jgi:hypothetical protein